MTRNDLSHPYGAGCILTCVLHVLGQGHSYKRSHIDFAHAEGVLTLSSHGAVIGDFPVGFQRGDVQDSLIQLAADHRQAVSELVLSTTAAWDLPEGYSITRSRFPHEDGGPLTYVDFYLESQKPSFDPEQVHGVIRVFLDVPEVRYWYFTGHRHSRKAVELVAGPRATELNPKRTYPAGLAQAQAKMGEAFRLFSEASTTADSQALPAAQHQHTEYAQQYLGITKH